MVGPYGPVASPDKGYTGVAGGVANRAAFAVAQGMALVGRISARSERERLHWEAVDREEAERNAWRGDYNNRAREAIKNEPYYQSSFIPTIRQVQ